MLFLSNIKEVKHIRYIFLIVIIFYFMLGLGIKSLNK